MPSTQNGPPYLWYRKIRIFVPPELDPEWWAETAVGCIIKPVVEKFDPVWFWFSRYEENETGSGTDCDLAQIPAAFCREGSYRSVRFRVCSDTETRQALEDATMELIASHGFRASGFLDYTHVDDLAQPRFLGEPRTSERMERRANLHARFLDGAARVFLDALQGPDAEGRFQLEPNAHYGSSFQAMRHLFCNMTNAPTPVWVDEHEIVQPHPSGEVVILVKPGRVMKRL